PNAVGHLAASLHRLWRERLMNTRILDWDTQPPHRLRFDSQTGILIEIDSNPIRTSSTGERLLKALSEANNEFVSRITLMEALYPQDRWDAIDLGPSLNNAIDRLRNEIEKTGVPANEVLREDNGAYMLWGTPG